MKGYRLSLNATWLEVKAQKRKLNGFSHAAGSAVRNLALRRERATAEPVEEIFWCTVPMGGMMMNWASINKSEYVRDEDQPEYRAAVVGKAYPVAGVKMVEVDEKGWPKGIEPKWSSRTKLGRCGTQLRERKVRIRSGSGIEKE